MAYAVTYSSACQGKVGFISRKEAKVLLRTAQRSDRPAPNAGRLMVYSCPYCAFFHIGHRPTKRNKKLRITDRVRSECDG